MLNYRGLPPHGSVRRSDRRAGETCQDRPARRIVAVAVAQSSPPNPKAPVKDPFEEKTIYNDSVTDLAFIKLYTDKMAAQIPNARVPLVAHYEDFVRVSKELMKGRSPLEQRLTVRNVLFSLMPRGMPEQFRKLFPPSQLSAEINARMATLGFGWLVGPTELKVDTIKVSPTESRVQNSVVVIKKCRYLEASGCVGLCVNLCKLPTQSFFTDDCGLPLTMVPNWEDLSCEMRFGEPPPPLDEDEVYKQPCFQPACPTGVNVKALPCPKLTLPG